MVAKKLIAISTALLCFIGAVSCDGIRKGIEEISEPKPTVGEMLNDYIYIWTDEETGVQYVVYREKNFNAGHGGITPRLNPDGSLYVVEPTTQNNSENVGEDNA
ncbi:MAG: DUF6440 family protein [Ruminococcus flavefaciens]|nr:DUF6440 family protein [Ruminococcus flavefaciens]MCM1059300.1 DUF6440 family protein [Eubacterium sp.]